MGFFADFVVVRFGPPKPYAESFQWIIRSPYRVVIISAISYSQLFQIFAQLPLREVYFVMGPTGCRTVMKGANNTEKRKAWRESYAACLAELDGA